MKLHLIVAAGAAALTLAACNQAQTPAAKQEAAADAVFPDLFQASYRVEASVRRDETDQLRPIVMVRAGNKMRIEITSDQGPVTIISNPDENAAYMVSQMAGRPIAMRVSLDQAQIPAEVTDWADGKDVTAGGPCAGAGETGTRWNVAPTEAEPVASSACVTSDGILLQATKGDVVTWEATRVARGAQDVAQFAPPPGAQVMDLGAMGAGARAAAERMKQQ